MNVVRVCKDDVKKWILVSSEGEAHLAFIQAKIERYYCLAASLSKLLGLVDCHNFV
jgi:hypothetical protein